MNEEIEKELESFLSSISPEDLKDMVDEFDSEFEYVPVDVKDIDEENCYA